MTIPQPHFSRRHLPRRLRRLIGLWRVEGQFVGGTKVLDVRGTATFRWLVKDALVLLRTRMTVAPWSTAILGADDEDNEFIMLYSDVRGVVRRYKMSLTASRWTFWRRAPGFHQRCIARIASNGRSMKAKWEKSADGRRWLRDFNLIYTKLRK
jgi:hypothetical protein